MINEFKDGDNISQVFLVKDVTKGITAKGLNYLNVSLQDRTGIIEAKKWDTQPIDLETIKKGAVLLIDGEVILYRDKLQLKIINAYRANKESSDFNTIVISSPIPEDELINSFNYYKNSVKNETLRKILDAIFDKYYRKFIVYPAAVRNHHEFYHGLIHHSVSMCKVAEQITKIYPNASYDLLISGCLLHDIGKVIEFSDPITPSYTNEGNLLGHISIGMSIIKETCDNLNIEGEIPMLLEHMILSHHGKLEYGSPITPLTREALLLSMIDDMDAKMMVLDKAYRDVDEGSYTDRIFALDNASYYKRHKM